MVLFDRGRQITCFDEWFCACYHSLSKAMQTFIAKCCLSKKHSMIRFVKHHICGALTTTHDRRPSSWSSFNNSFSQLCGNAYRVSPSVTTGLGYYLTNLVNLLISFPTPYFDWMKKILMSYSALVQPLGSCLSRSWVVDPVFWGFMMHFWFMKLLCSTVSSVVFTLLFLSPGLFAI